MISCNEFMAAFGDLLEGDVADEIRQQLENHVGHCKTCQVIYDTSRKTLRIITDSGSFDLSEAAARPVRERIMDRIRKEQAH